MLNTRMEEDPISATYLAKIRKYNMKKWAEDRRRFGAPACEEFSEFMKGKV